MSQIINNQPVTLKTYLGKLFSNHYLLTILIKRELKIKYSKRFFGLGWVFLQPALVVLVYTLFFKNMLKLNTYDVPYPQFVLTGLVLWYLSTGIISKCMYAFFESKELISKTNFPKIIILLSKIAPVILECFALLILSFIVVAYSQKQFNLNMLSSVFYFIDVLILSLAIGTFCSILTMKFRDLLEVIPFVINFAIWLTPIFYTFDSVPDTYKTLFRFCNPLIIPLEGLRNALFENRGITLEAFLIFIITLIVFIASFIVFVKFEKSISSKI